MRAPQRTRKDWKGRLRTHSSTSSAAKPHFCRMNLWQSCASSAERLPHLVFPPDPSRKTVRGLRPSRAAQRRLLWRLQCWPFHRPALHHIRLNRRLLIGDKINFRIEIPVAWQADLDLVLSRCNQQGTAHSLKLRDVPHVDSIDKDRGTIRLHVELDLSRNFRQGNPRVFLHLHVEGLFFSRLHSYFLIEVEISSLAHGDVVFTRQQQKLFRSLQLVEIANILSVDPDAGSVLDF